MVFLLYPREEFGRLSPQDREKLVEDLAFCSGMNLERFPVGGNLQAQAKQLSIMYRQHVKARQTVMKQMLSDATEMAAKIVSGLPQFIMTDPTMREMTALLGLLEVRHNNQKRRAGRGRVETALPPREQMH